MISRELNRYDFEFKVFLFKLTVLVGGYLAISNQPLKISKMKKTRFGVLPWQVRQLYLFQPVLAELN